ncbi:MAG TPA: hypothetical protein PKE29_04450 [Phycisphaerales bacterium]|nr:hypothetical protein [Phycisphaerales bacterium]
MIMSFHQHAMAVNRVEQRLRRVTAALDAASVPYAVVGGNAVAAWVSTIDPAAARTTKDVDLLVDRSQVDPVTRTLGGLGFRREDLRDLVVFLDPDEPSRRSGVHLVWAGERIRPSNPVVSPTVDESVRSPEGFRVVTLPALVRMKLTSFRPIDQAHLEDMLELGLIDAAVRAALPHELLGRLAQIESARGDE